MVATARRALELFEQNPEFLEICAMGMFRDTIGLRLGLEWEHLSDNGRQDWRNAVVEVQKQFCNLPEDAQDWVQFEDIKKRIAETV
jgi:hypothetical protein